MLTKNFLRGRRRRELSEAEKAALEAAVDRVERVPARRTVVRRDEPVRNSTLLLSGAMCRYMDARDGIRQLVCYHVPGDFVDLHGYPTKWLDHDVATLTDVELAIVPHAALDSLCADFPHLARLMWFSTLLDAALHREWIFRLGRLDARGRIAHFLCETYARLKAVGEADGGAFTLPLTQQDIGEACGLTGIHVNRTLRLLRETGLAEIVERRVTIRDWSGLSALGEFVPDYLYLEGVSLP